MRTPRTVYGRLPRSLALFTLAVAAISNARADYPALVQSDNPKAYYRLNDSTARALIHTNLGTLGAAGNGTNDPLYYKGGQLPTGIVHPFSGAIVGDGNRSEFFDYTTRIEIPFNSAFNTPNTQPFTVEAWFYPASDLTNPGPAPINNRYTAGSNRQGWTFFQRRPDTTYTCCDGGLGWNFRMYNGVGGATPMDIQSLTPYQLGKWQHVVVVYDPVDATDATLTIYIDGVQANQQIYSGTAPGYAPCTGDHPPTEATSGQPNLSIGCYNNANTGLNPYFGGVDEFAWYPSKLTPAQILAHYQNGTNANRTTPYDALVKSANPTLYLRLDEIAPSPDLAINLGSVQAAGFGTNTAEARHPATGALAGRTDDGAFAGHWRNGSATLDLPYMAENNPDISVPLTIEAWFRPTSDRLNPGAAPINNRLAGSAVNRSGWVYFQRAPNSSYGGDVGWDLRLYTGSGSSSSDIVSQVPYTIGQWQHVVTTWDGGSTLTMYVDGVQVAQNTSATYAPNINPPAPPDDALAPADFAVGAYNVASGLGQNAFEGDVDEVAIYNGYMLTPDQVLEHYMAGTNSNYGTNYETLVLTANPTGTQLTGLPKTYLHFNDPAHYPVANSGTLSSSADGNLVLTTNIAAGPQSPTYPGFDSANVALPLDGGKQWASFNNPSGLNISGQITLEAWVKPAATQGTTARIISHGPETLSSFLGQGKDGAITNSSEVFLRIEGSGTDYAVGSAQYDDATATTTTHEATFAVPAGDLGSSSWIHLVGTYDGANWKLYRNGTLVATHADAVGALTVNDADWAIGSTGNGWADNFAGTVDEVAIYDHALSASQITGHFNAGTLPARLTIVRSAGNNVTITWPYGTLYQADNVTGPWTAVPGNPSSPYTTSAGAAKKFYRF